MDKVGGLDEYLLGEKPARIKELGVGGWLLRWRLMQTDTVRQRLAQQRAQMGLPPLTEEEQRMASDGTLVSEEVVQQETRDFDRILDESDRVVELEEGNESQSNKLPDSVSPARMGSRVATEG